MKLDIPFLIENMTLEEKAGLCSGADSWRTKPVARIGLPQIMVSDGPHGLRKQSKDGDNLGLNGSVKAVCFPAGSALASSFDRKLMGALGETLGDAARAERIHTVLGPAINIKRSPLCGRNFEYLSEDPFLAGEMAASYVNGVQSKNVGVSVKHFAANNQEYCRMSTDTIVSERALREIYLSAFEKTVKNAKPWTIMCAYNKINGTYCCENEWLLTKVLREEWGFDGIVMTDWGAMDDKIASLKAGLALEMPSSSGLRDREIVDAVNSGMLSVERLNETVGDLLRWIEKGCSCDGETENYDVEGQHEFSRRCAEDCAVLLKNERDVLPLSKENSAVFIGSFAKIPRFQGGGSSHINAVKIVSAAAAAKNMKNVSFEPGWGENGETGDTALLNAAVAAAKDAKAAVIFAGLPDSFECEGYDRTHLNLPDCQNELIREVCAVQPNTVVVLHTGSPVVMPWIESVAAVLNVYLGGEAVGEAAVNLLFGDASPSGRLAETYPLKLEDTPAYLNFPGDGKKVVYAEDVFVGYRWYDSRKMPVLFPFGFGLGYTNFCIDDMWLSEEAYSGGGVSVTARVTNTGKRTGKCVVQLYIAPPEKMLKARPTHELHGFEKIELLPGESKTVSFTLDDRSFSYFNEDIKRWHLESGEYTIELGFSSRDLPLKAKLNVKGEKLPLLFDECVTVGDIIAAGKADSLGDLLKQLNIAFGIDASNTKELENLQVAGAMINSMPLHSIPSFVKVPEGYLEDIKARCEEK